LRKKRERSFLYNNSLPEKKIRSRNVKEIKKEKKKLLSPWTVASLFRPNKIKHGRVTVSSAYKIFGSGPTTVQKLSKISLSVVSILGIFCADPRAPFVHF
jgi:hypothetical protein